MKTNTKAAFKKEIRKSGDKMLRMEQLSNEFPLHAPVIMQAMAEVMAEGVTL